MKLRQKSNAESCLELRWFPVHKVSCWAQAEKKRARDDDTCIQAPHITMDHRTLKFNNEIEKREPRPSSELSAKWKKNKVADRHTRLMQEMEKYVIERKHFITLGNRRACMPNSRTTKTKKKTNAHKIWRLIWWRWKRDAPITAWPRRHEKNIEKKTVKAKYRVAQPSDSVRSCTQTRCVMRATQWYHCKKKKSKKKSFRSCSSIKTHTTRTLVLCNLIFTVNGYFLFTAFTDWRDWSGQLIKLSAIAEHRIVTHSFFDCVFLSSLQ